MQQYQLIQLFKGLLSANEQKDIALQESIYNMISRKINQEQTALDGEEELFGIHSQYIASDGKTAIIFTVTATEMKLDFLASNNPE